MRKIGASVQSVQYKEISRLTPQSLAPRPTRPYRAASSTSVVRSMEGRAGERKICRHVLLMAHPTTELHNESLRRRHEALVWRSHPPVACAAPYSPVPSGEQHQRGEGRSSELSMMPLACGGLMLVTRQCFKSHAWDVGALFTRLCVVLQRGATSAENSSARLAPLQLIARSMRPGSKHMRVFVGKLDTRGR